MIFVFALTPTSWQGLTTSCANTEKYALLFLLSGILGFQEGFPLLSASLPYSSISLSERGDLVVIEVSDLLMEVEIELVKRNAANSSPAIERLEEIIRQVVDDRHLHI